jgi:AcrR family transcriptional regulator
VEELLTAAAQVFEARGYAGATTNHIAARAGVSIGTLYQYFPSKEAITVALLERHLAETDARLQQWVGHLAAERHDLSSALADYVTGMLEMHSDRPMLQHILLEETPLPERVHHALLEGERAAGRTMATLLAAFPEASPASLEPAGALVVQTVESLTHRFAAHPREPFVERAVFIREVVAMLFAYLTHGSPHSGPPR